MGRVVLFGLLCVVAGVVAALVYLPWWAVLALLVAVAALGWLFGGMILKQLFMMPFRAKGRVLHGARIEVHGITPAPAPTSQRPRDDEDPEVKRMADEEDADVASRHWFHVDVTVTPTAPAGAFQLWEPSELLIVGPEARPVPADDEDDDGHCRVHDLEIFRDGAFVHDDGDKLPGPVRLRLHCGVRPNSPALQFRYYFELFGQVVFPGSAASAPAGSPR